MFEPRQGCRTPVTRVSPAHGRSIVAFTDDDVRVRPDWVRVIKESFDARPDVACVSGPILPVWESTAARVAHLPALVRACWHFRTTVTNRCYWIGRTPLSLAGANLAFRIQVFDRIGRFSPAYARAEDSEFLLRFWRHGLPCRDTCPAMIIDALVPPERMTKDYHRRWHVHTGSFTRLAEELSAAGESPQIARVLGLPGFAFGELAAEGLAWFGHASRGRRG